jgi:hypothetical protein
VKTYPIPKRGVMQIDSLHHVSATLAEMRNSDPPVQYLVGTPKGRLNRLEKTCWKNPGRTRARA